MTLSFDLDFKSLSSKLLLCLACLFFITSCSKNDTPPEESSENNHKAFSVANVFQSNMVIQRDKPVRIWGNASAASKVTITTSWQNKSFTANTNTLGSWETVIPASPANAIPQVISVAVDGEQPLKLENILIGDVWVCAGQSNMVMPMGNIPPFGGVENFKSEIAVADYPLIRSLTVTEDYQNQPANEFTHLSKWTICTPRSAERLSAAAYFFARKIHTELGVPVGIVISAVNGSWCETWTNKDALQDDPVLNSLFIGSHQSSMLYNGMISPLTKFTIKGFTWYQGENNQNISPPENYTKLNSALIRGWRSVFNQGDLPFYYVQMTPFDDGASGNTSLSNYAKFREAQTNIRGLMQRTGMAVTMDAGEVNNHHPMYKKQVGERLALLALNQAYNLNVQCIGPQYSSFAQTNDLVTVSFVSGTANGLNTINGNNLKQYFSVAGTDHEFRMATATIQGNKIKISIPANTPLPIMAVRYAFTNFPVTNLQNSAGLPMEPFRTDTWSN